MDGHRFLESVRQLLRIISDRMRKMNTGDNFHGERPGPIAYMAGNSVAANLLMWAIIAAGLVSLTGLDREAWPTTPFYHIEVSMAYPGATPEEIEESIVVKIEDQVSGLDDVKAVKSVAAPGIASVRVQNGFRYGHGAGVERYRVRGQSHSVFPGRRRSSQFPGDGLTA